MGAKLSYPRDQDIPEDRTYIVTGGNTGIGYQTTKCIAKQGGRVIIACRSEERAKEAIEKMQTEHQEEVRKSRADEKAAVAKKAAAEKAAADKAAAAEKAAADKAAAAEKAAADKAAAAEKAAAAKAAKAAEKSSASKDEEKKDDATKEDGAAPDAAKEDGAKEEAPKEESAKEEATKEDAPKEEGTKAADESATKEEDAPKETEGAAAAAATTDADKPTENSTAEAKTEESEPEEPIAPLKVEFMKLDLESFASTMEFVNAYKAKGYPLHVLICNAGFGAGPQKKTDDGHEHHLQVNYLSHFLMTLHLLPLLKQSAPNSRIVNVSSVVHSQGVLNLDNMNGEQSYDRMKFYGSSKLYQIMSMYSLARRLGEDSKISVFSVHPGYVDSDFNKGTADSKLYSFMDSLAGTFRMKRSVQDGAMTTLVAALDAQYDGKTALFFKNCKAVNPSALSRKVPQQDSLWKYSIECLKEHINDDLLKDLQIPEPEPVAEPKPAEEAKKPEGDAVEAGAGGDNAPAAGGGSAPAEGETAEKKEEPKQEESTPSGDAPEKKEEEGEKKGEEKVEEAKEE